MHVRPSYWVRGHVFFLGYIALKIWIIILTIDQHGHLLIVGFEMDVQENGKENPCMKILLKKMKSWEMIVPF